MESTIEEVAEHLKGAERVLVITGAGISVDSGLPTYRGIGGLYEAKPTEEGLTIDQALSGSMFAARPDITWKYIHQIEEACRGAVHNEGHERIAALQEQAEVVVLTQNVDGFHTDAGSSAVIEMHGNLRRLRCTGCDWKELVRDYSELDALPRCPSCDAVIRPDVILFEEWLPHAAVRRYEEELERGFDLILSVGTSSLFPYIARPVLLGPEMEAMTVEINPGTSRVTPVVDIHLKMGATEALRAIQGA